MNAHTRVRPGDLVWVHQILPVTPINPLDAWLPGTLVSGVDPNGNCVVCIKVRRHRQRGFPPVNAGFRVSNENKLFPAIWVHLPAEMERLVGAGGLMR